MGRLSDAELATAGLKAPQLGVLSEILRSQPVRPIELALGLDSSTLTCNLKPLLAARWVELGAGSDARCRTIRITESGRIKQAQAQRGLRVAQRATDKRLGAQRMASANALMGESLSILAVVPR